MTEVAAIIEHVGIGTRGDPDGPVLWFDTYVSEGSVALQILDWDEAGKVLGQVNDIRELEGHACWVELDQAKRSIKFVRLWGKLP